MFLMMILQARAVKRYELKMSNENHEKKPIFEPHVHHHRQQTNRNSNIDHDGRYKIMEIRHEAMRHDAASDTATNSIEQSSSATQRQEHAFYPILCLLIPAGMCIFCCIFGRRCTKQIFPRQNEECSTKNVPP